MTDLRVRITQALIDRLLANVAPGRSLRPDTLLLVEDSAVANTDAVMEVVEPELAQLRTELAHATEFQIGDVTVQKLAGGEWRTLWPSPSWPGRQGRVPRLTEDHPDRATALARAREIAEGDDQ